MAGIEVQRPNATPLYVGDLDPYVRESDLYEQFNKVGQVVSVRVCKDSTTGRSLGYGYVNYGDPQDAARALDVLNFTFLHGKPIRIMYSHRDPSIRQSGAGNIFIKNLDKSIDHKALHDMFSAFGNILSCKVATDSSGLSKGYGFVQFDNEESAREAIEMLNGMLLNDKQVFVGPFLHKQERETVIDKTKLNNVSVKNLSESTTEEDLRKVFAQYGTITSVVVVRDGNGKSKCFGFVNFENSEDAARSITVLNGLKFDDKEWYVEKVLKKSERDSEQSVKDVADKFQGTNLYVKNMDDSIDDDKLKELFSQFGAITSCKVMRHPNGISRQSGFVAFTTPEEASRALAEMNGKMVVASKPLYVALAERKEDRRARLQAQMSQMHQVGTGLGPQILYDQARPAIIPPQMLPTHIYNYPPGNGLLPVPKYISDMLLQDPAPSPRIPIGALITALANATPTQQRTMLGETLYPRVEQLEHVMAAKVTGMLLEMDQTKILHLLDSPGALKAKVSEAKEVLTNFAPTQLANGAADRRESLVC